MVVKGILIQVGTVVVACDQSHSWPVQRQNKIKSPIDLSCQPPLVNFFFIRAHNLATFDRWQVWKRPSQNIAIMCVFLILNKSMKLFYFCSLSMTNQTVCSEHWIEDYRTWEVVTHFKVWREGPERGVSRLQQSSKCHTLSNSLCLLCVAQFLSKVCSFPLLQYLHCF